MPKILFLGDSITHGHGASSPDKNYVSLLRNDGYECLNYGIGGTRIGKNIEPYPESIHYGDDFYTRAHRMDKEADFVFVFGGVNDFGHGNQPFGEIGDKTEETFCGTFDLLLDYLIQTYGRDKIAVILPIRVFDEEKPWHYYGQENRPPFVAFRDAERKIAEEKGVDVIDLRDRMPKHDAAPWTPSEYWIDGLHPNDKGYRLIHGVLLTYLCRKVG